MVELPNVLIAAPVSERHGHLLDEWIAHLDSLNYPNFDVLLVDTTLDKENYYNRIKEIKVKGKNIITMRYNWNPDELHPLQMLANAREMIRKYFIENNYDYLFFLDDDIFIPKYGIEKLLSANKDCVGFYVHIFYKPRTKPCLLKSGEIILGKGLDYFTWKEINEYKKFVKKFRKNKLSESEKNLVPFIIDDIWHPNLIKIYGVNLGCLLIKRKVLESIQFRTHPTFIFGEDLWFFAEANDKHFEFWCDTDIRAKHKNTEWNSVISKTKRKMEFWVAYGPANAKEAMLVKR